VNDGHALFNLPVKARVIAVSPDGKLLAVSDAQNWIALYHARDGEVVRETWPSGERVWNLTFSPDSSQLVESGWSSEVRVWNLTQPTASPQLLRHPLSTWDAAFSPDGRVLAIACSDRQVHLWNTQTWQETRVLRGHFNEVWALAWQPDGRLLSAGRDPRVLRMRADARSENRYARHDDYSFNVVWIGDDRLATVREVGGTAVAEIAPVGRAGDSVHFAGEIPLAFDEQRGRLWLWADGRELRARRVADLADVVRVPLSLEKGETMVGVPEIVPEAGRAWVALADRSLVVYRSDDGRRVGRYENVFVHPTGAVALSPNGRHFVWGGVSTELFMLDLDMGRRLALGGHRYEVSCVAFAPDGQTFLSGGADGLIIEWDARSGRQLRELGRHATSVGRLAYSPDGKVVLSQEQGVGIHLWQPATGREVGFIPEKRAEANQWLGISPDGRWFGLRLADGTIRTIRIATATGEAP
jgi:WD40 repeat protein